MVQNIHPITSPAIKKAFICIPYHQYIYQTNLFIQILTEISIGGFTTWNVSSPIQDCVVSTTLAIATILIIAYSTNLSK